MRKWVAGEMDFHDQVVEQYKQGIIRRYQQEQADRERRAAEAAQVAAEAGEDPLVIQPLIGFSREDLLHMLRGRGNDPNHRVAQVFEDRKGQEYLYEKYLEKPATPGGLEVRGGRVAPTMPRHIQREIAQRQVQYGVEGKDEE